MAESEDPAREKRKTPLWQLLINGGVIAAFVGVSPALLGQVRGMIQDWRGSLQETTVDNPSQATPANFRNVVRTAADEAVLQKARFADFVVTQPACFAAPATSFVTANNIEVSAKICSGTGDVVVEMRSLVDKNRAQWTITKTDLLFDDRIAGGFVAAAHAAPAPLRLQQLGTDAIRASMVCYRVNSDGSILRHLREGDRCYDELWSGAGRLIHRVETPCRTTCGG